MKVRATRIGYYGEKRRLEGEVFTLVPVKAKDEDGKQVEVSPEDQFSEKWMEKTELDPAQGNQKFHPARVQNAADTRDVNRVVDETLGDESVAANGGVNRIHGATVGQASAEDAGDDSGEEGRKPHSRRRKSASNEEVI
jgi:hypothetical protein